MELNKFKNMTEVELNAELEKMKKELFNLRFQHVTGQLENPVQMRELKTMADWKVLTKAYLPILQGCHISIPASGL